MADHLDSNDVEFDLDLDLPPVEPLLTDDSLVPVPPLLAVDSGELDIDDTYPISSTDLEQHVNISPENLNIGHSYLRSPSVSDSQSENSIGKNISEEENKASRSPSLSNSESSLSSSPVASPTNDFDLNDSDDVTTNIRSKSVDSVKSKNSDSLSVSRSNSPANGDVSKRISQSASRSVSPLGSHSRSASPVNRKKKKQSNIQSDDSDKESESGNAIAEIFGSSDEEGEFEGFGEEEEKGTLKDTNAIVPDISDESGEEDNNREIEDKPGEVMVSDFDLMMERRKVENARSRSRRRKHGVEDLNSNDDMISELIRRMKEAAEDDRQLNLAKEPAIRKVSMLPVVEAQLQRSDLHLALLDMNVLGAITEWLSPLPNKSLPNLQIRITLLRLLSEFPPISTDLLKMSGVGKAIMFLLKHPKETKQNKKIASRLIHEWARPIFNLNSNYSSMTKEQREERDYSQITKRKRLSSSETKKMEELNQQSKSAKPGEPGWVSRARVPQPSTKDYIIRPKSNHLEKPKHSGKKVISRFEKHKREMEEKKKQRKAQFGQSIVGMSIEGKNLAL